MSSTFLSIHTPMSAAALCLLLAACGGGGGSSTTDKNVSSSPGNPPASTAPSDSTGSSSGGSSATTPGAGSAGGGTGTVPGGTTPSVTATTDQTITDSGIRGDVLRSMLDQRINPTGLRGTRTSSSLADGRYGWYTPDPATPSIANTAYLTPTNYVSKPLPGNGGTYLDYQPLNGRSEYTLSSVIESYWSANQNTTVLFRPLEMKVGIQADATQVALADTLALEVKAPRATATAQPEGTESFALKAASAPAIKAEQLVPFGQVVQSWQDAQGNKVELTLAGRCNVVQVEGQSGQVDDNAPRRSPGAELCWNITVDKLKRQACMMFAVPETTIAAGAQAGQLAEHRFDEMADDRSFYPGGSGVMVWRAGSHRCEGKGSLK